MAQASPYKTHLGWRNYLGVSVLVHSEQVPIEGTVCDINLTGVVILFRRGAAPELHRGDTVTVRLTASWLPRPLVAPASLVRTRKDVDGLVYEFSFDDHGLIERQITPVLHSVFNRRHAPRVVPDAEDDRRVAYQSASDEQSHLGELHQVSSTGMSLVVGRADDPGTEIGTCVGLSFFLAGRQEPTHVVAHLRNRREEGPNTVLGFEFDQEQTEGFARLQGAILGYVLSRAPVPVKLFDERAPT